METVGQERWLYDAHQFYMGIMRDNSSEVKTVMYAMLANRTACMNQGHKIMTFNYYEVAGFRFRHVSCADCGAVIRIHREKWTPVYLPTGPDSA